METSSFDVGLLTLASRGMEATEELEDTKTKKIHHLVKGEGKKEKIIKEIERKQHLTNSQQSKDAPGLKGLFE